MAERVRRRNGAVNSHLMEEELSESRQRLETETERGGGRSLSDSSVSAGAQGKPVLSRVEGGMIIQRYFTHPRENPFDLVEWEKRSAVISGEKGEIVFEQRDVEVPKLWSQLATNVVVSKYFRGPLGTPQREHSVRQLIGRVVQTITGWGQKDGYFATEEEACAFADELTHLLLHQKASFNSPVWFNVGVEPEGKAQCSACFILSVEDTMESILDWYKKEGIIFKGGSGSGINLSKIRSSRERLSGGGLASGPVSFMRAADASAGVIKSGGKCLAPWQRVYTERGPVEVRELAERGEDFIVLSYDPPSGRYKAKRARAWQTGRKEIVRLRTDKGDFCLSSDHPMKLSSGEFCPAGSLKPGMSLFACTVDAPQSYLRVHLRDGKKGKELLHRLVMQDVMGEDLVGKVVHHKDHDRTNNHPANLYVVAQADHAQIHGRETAEKGTHIFQNLRFSHAGENNGMHHMSAFWQDQEKVCRYRQKQRDILVSCSRASEMQDLAARQRMLNTAFLILNAGRSIDSFEAYIEGRKRYIGRIPSIRQLRQAIDRRFGSYENFVKEAAASNHRVVGVEILGFMDVYDVEVDCPTPDDKSPQSGHNLVIWPDSSPTGSGIVVSNTRRAAKMVVLNVDHPDIVEFVRCKAEEEKKAWALIEAGYDGSLDGPAYNSIFFQNANNSVRVTDDFMRAVIEDREWHTRFVTTGEVCETYKARDLLRMIAEATWQCGDPGMQFDTTINAWHTCPNSGRINASNPCSEYMHLDNSACNLASLNLMKFLKDDGTFDVAAFRHAADVMITAQDIIVDNSSYPTSEITANAKAFRELGLGYANLGALLMSLGLPYDSEAGRQHAAAITALMTGEAYLQSARLAEQLGPFYGYAANREPTLGVIEKHRNYAYKLDPSLVPLDLLSEARRVWDEALELGKQAGYRNSQTVVIAPTGTISFMLDCDTTGVEPDIALVKYKRLVGGGLLKMVNNTVARALNRLGYDSKEVQEIVEYIDEHETIEGAPGLKDKHLPVFDCAFKPVQGTRSIHYLGHLKMVAAVQPFLSGAVSKTVNVPSQVTVEEIADAYVQAWKQGLKAVAIYRDGCKRVQPLSTSRARARGSGLVSDEHESREPNTKPVRHRLPTDRQALCHKFEIAGHEGYIHVGFYEDGTPGEIFIKMAKEGSTISGLMDAVGLLTSMALQYGVPLEVLVDKFSHVRFEPSGFTKNPDIPYAKSLIDYLFRFLGTRFLTPEQKREVGLIETERGREEETTLPFSHTPTLPRSVSFRPQADAPSCPDCGAIMVRNGSCYKCLNCGATSGCS